jgi:ADP-heptose:LPS heptosyltransferase
MRLFKPKSSNGVTPVETISPQKRLVVRSDAVASRRSSIRDELEFLEAKNVRVCIQRSCGGLGDILMCTPLFQAIKEEYPAVELTFAIDMKSAGDSYYQLVKNNPYVDKVISSKDVNRDHYHLFKDISSVCLAYENSGLPWINRIDIFANACGFKLKDPVVYYKVEDSERLWANGFIAKALNGTPRKDKKLVMLHTASYDVKRTWPIKKYTEFITAVNEKRSDVLYFVNDFQRLNPYWSSVKNVIDVSQFKIREIAALTEQMDLFVGPDSGPMHIAGALKTPGVILFGSIPPASRINHYPSLEAITATGLACLGCGYKPCPFNIKCMTSLSADSVATRAVSRL